MRNIVLALDPSGNFSEGKGTTGYCISRDGYIYSAGQICSAEYPTQMEYWNKVVRLIEELNEENPDDFQVVCEDYRLYRSASDAQINSNLETPQFIGVIKWTCFKNDIPITMQMAAEVKTRWSNEVLLRKKLIKYVGRNIYIGNVKLGHHSIDAVRHCMHFNTFKVRTRVRNYKPKRKTEYKNY